MNAGDIIRLFRIQNNDLEAPYKWSDEALFLYLNEAEKEAARRARLLIDSTTAAVCTINVLANTPSYPLHESVIFVRRAKLASRNRPLQQISHLDLDDTGMDWESATGTIEAYMTDFETDTLRLWRTPLVVDTLSLTVVRTPLTPMNDVTDTPEIKSRYHEKLVHWMRYRAYSIDDDEIKDTSKAAAAYSLFEEEFGPASSAIDEEWQHRKSYDPDDGRF